MNTVIVFTLLLVNISLSEGFRLEKQFSPVGEVERGLAGGEPELEELVPQRRERGLWEPSWGREVEEHERYGVLAPL